MTCPSLGHYWTLLAVCHHLSARLTKRAVLLISIQAAALNPPRPPISWKDITQYTFLGEFDLLWHTRDDVRERVWAKPAVREVTAKFFKLCRAKEEITRLNVEMRRL